MANRPAFALLLLAAALFPLANQYFPGSVAPPQAWFPLHGADFASARHLADSLLPAYEKQGWVQRNPSANRLEGRTIIAPQLVEALSGSRINEKGMVWLNGKMIGEAALLNFNLNWVDFFGALIETEYKPQGRFPVSQVTPGAVLVMGPKARSVKSVTLKANSVEEKLVKQYFLSLKRAPVEFIKDVSLSVYDYPAAKNRLLVLVNFMTDGGYAPGALYLLEKRADSLSTVSNYFIGEKAELLQALQEPGDANPVFQTRTSGAGEEYILVRFNGKAFEAVYKRVESEFP